MRVEFHPDAEREFIESALFYERRVTGLGFRFIHEVNHYIDILQDHPRLGQITKNDFRHLVMGHFPYSLIYTIEPEFIWIIAVAHQYQRPGYWRERINR